MKKKLIKSLFFDLAKMYHVCVSERTHIQEIMHTETAR